MSKPLHARKVLPSKNSLRLTLLTALLTSNLGLFDSSHLFSHGGWIVPPAAFADAIRPDIAELMEVSKLKELSESSLKQVQAAFEKQFSASLAGNPNAAAAAKKMMDRLNPIMEKRLSWEVMKDEYATLYSETFTPEEVKGLIDFYKTPIGQSFLKKMPTLMQKAAQLSAKRVQDMLPEIQRIAAEVARETQAQGVTPSVAQSAPQPSATATPTPRPAKKKK